MLLTNGCSFVWGDELDGFDTDPPSHQHLTFSYLLSQKLEVPLVNLATCGACNAKIFRDTTDYLRKCDQLPTHMVILWSGWERSEVPENIPIDREKTLGIQRWQNMTQISPARLHNLSRNLADTLDVYYDVVNVVKHGMIQTVNYMTHMQWLCETLGIKLIQGVFHRRMWNQLGYETAEKISQKTRPWSDWAEYIKNSIGDLKDTSRVGLGKYIDLFSLAEEKYTIKPHQHPDEDAQVEYADILYNIFKNEFDK